MTTVQPVLADSFPGEVLVMGAGAVGCYVGGCLASVGVPVTLVGRVHRLSALARVGLHLTDREGGSHRAEPEQFKVAAKPLPGMQPALVLLCVKSRATARAAADLAAVLPSNTPVLSLQNGISNVAIAQAMAPHLKVLPGMVPYHIVELGPGVFHRGTSGRMAALRDAALEPWVPVFEHAGIPLDLRSRLLTVQWGKLLINLNNPINALSGMPLRDELLNRDYRRCFAALMDEALHVLRVAGIRPANMTIIPSSFVPTVLRLPTWLFRVLAVRYLRIDSSARSSMADDLSLGRRTEIDAFCGAVVRLAQDHGLTAPRNARMMQLLDGNWPEVPVRMSGLELREVLGL